MNTFSTQFGPAMLPTQSAMAALHANFLVAIPTPFGIAVFPVLSGLPAEFGGGACPIQCGTDVSPTKFGMAVFAPLSMEVSYFDRVWAFPPPF